jgi:branched-chain amino acid transport system substrate-binding protein
VARSGGLPEAGDTRGAPGAAGGGSPARDPGPPSRRRSVTWLVALLGVGTAAVVMLATVLVLLSPPAQEASVAVQRVLDEPVRAAAGGVTASEIVVGMASPLSGANRELGRGMKAGVEAAFAEVNAGGGVHGRRLRLVALDDGYEPSRTLPVMRRLVEDEQVFAVVGNVGTPTAAVSIPYATSRKVVFFGAFTGGELLRHDPPDRYVFNFRPSYAEEASAAVRWLADVRRVSPRRIAVFSQDDEFGESGFRGVARELAARGVDPASVPRVSYRRNTADVDDAVESLRARAAEVDAVVMVATYRAASGFVRRVRDARLPFVLTNVSAVDASALAEELVAAGPRYTRDVIVTQVVPLPTSRSPAVARWREALERHAPDARRGFVALEGWIVGNLFAEALRRAGPDLDTEKLVTALEAMKEIDLGIGAPLSFGPDEHQASHKVWGTALQPDGTYRQIALE